MICSVSIPPDVNPDNIELGWLNEDDFITDDSRINLNTSNDSFNDSTLVAIIQFDPLSEENEGEYICYAVINGSFIFESINLQNFRSTLVKQAIHIIHICICILMCTYICNLYM